MKPPEEPVDQDQEQEQPTATACIRAREALRPAPESP